jgi:hypothetical protein
LRAFCFDLTPQRHRNDNADGVSMLIRHEQKEKEKEKEKEKGTSLIVMIKDFINVSDANISDVPFSYLADEPHAPVLPEACHETIGE